MLYRLYVEDFDRPIIVKSVLRFFQNFTIIEGVGYCGGEQENSVIIEIESIGGPPQFARRIVSLISLLKSEGNQDSILLQKVCNRANFL